MSKKEDTTLLEVISVVIGVIVVGAIALGVGFLLVVGFKKIWPDHFMEFKYSYCLEDKKITKADGIYEDNGKYEDESYRVTYEDGSVGLVDQAQMKTGRVCTKTIDLYADDPRTEGLTKVRDY